MLIISCDQTKLYIMRYLMLQKRIDDLEVELTESQKKADQMKEILESSRAHYTMLESKYEQANQLLRSYQERLVVLDLMVRKFDVNNY